MGHKLSERLLVKKGDSVKLSEWDPEDDHGWSREEAESETEKNLERMSQLQEKLWASRTHALLTVLQAMDTAGKDSTIRRVMGHLNPQGCEVTGFKVPTEQEREHDFLWRVHKAVPGKGEIGIFNRSHYEDVLVVRVHNLAPEPVWRKRYDQIREFEQLLHQTGTSIRKFFLHISKEEQKQRLQDRLDDPAKHWKFRLGDLDERALWSGYEAAYQDAIAETTRDHAPWFIIPANRKWFRDLAVSQILVEALEEMDLRFPEPEEDLTQVIIE
ncbi:MAG: polyphosphate kinase 2 family protein [Bryobacteraceae bacterium]